MPEDLKTKDVVVVGLGLGLIGGAVYLMTRKVGKRWGDKLTAKIAFAARGQGTQTLEVGFGLAPAQLMGHGTVFQSYSVTQDFELTEDFQKFYVTIKDKLPEVGTVGDGNKLDALLFVKLAGKTLKEVWRDDVIQIKP